MTCPVAQGVTLDQRQPNDNHKCIYQMWDRPTAQITGFLVGCMFVIVSRAGIRQQDVSHRFGH